MPKAKAPTTIIMMVMAASMIPPAYPKWGVHGNAASWAWQ
jgi:hypothetical protein